MKDIVYVRKTSKEELWNQNLDRRGEYKENIKLSSSDANLLEKKWYTSWYMLFDKELYNNCTRKVETYEFDKKKHQGADMNRVKLYKINVPFQSVSW